MKTELPPVSFGAVTLDANTVLIGAVVVVIILAIALGARRETALVAVMLGVIGVLLAA